MDKFRISYELKKVIHKSIPFFFILLFILPKITTAQYLIKGQIDSITEYELVHLDIFDSWDFFNSVSDVSIVKTKKINSDGTFEFKGTELPEKRGFYRIRYTEVGEGVSINFGNRNYVNFIFSNHDTISIKNTSFYSRKDENKLLAEYIEQDDQFKKEKSLSKIKRNSKMLLEKYQQQCIHEIQNSNNGLTNLFKLYTSEIGIEENPELFDKVQSELKSEEIRPEYHHSLSLFMHVHNYNFINKKIGWLSKILIASFIVNFFLIMYLLKNRKSKTNSHQISTNRNLTNKETQVLQLIKSQKTNKEIASELYVSEATIKTHINNIYRKLNVKSRKEAIQSTET